MSSPDFSPSTAHPSSQAYDVLVLSDLHLSSSPTGQVCDPKHFDCLMLLIESWHQGDRPTHLVLNGDIIELWSFTFGAAAPTPAEVLSDEYAKERDASVQDTDHATAGHVSQARQFFRCLRAAVDARASTPNPLTVTYIPGNHDSFLRTDPALQRRFWDEEELQWMTFQTAAYDVDGVRVEHGHDFDLFNHDSVDVSHSALPVGYYVSRAGATITGANTESYNQKEHSPGLVGSLVNMFLAGAPTIAGWVLRNNFAALLHSMFAAGMQVDFKAVAGMKTTMAVGSGGEVVERTLEELVQHFARLPQQMTAYLMQQGNRSERAANTEVVMMASAGNGDFVPFWYKWVQGYAAAAKTGGPARRVLVLGHTHTEMIQPTDAYVLVNDGTWTGKKSTFVRVRVEGGLPSGVQLVHIPVGDAAAAASPLPAEKLLGDLVWSAGAWKARQRVFAPTYLLGAASAMASPGAMAFASGEPAALSLSVDHNSAVRQNVSLEDAATLYAMLDAEANAEGEEEAAVASAAIAVSRA